MKKLFLTLFTLLIAAVFIGTAVFLYNKSQEKPVVFETATAFTADIVKKTVATGSIRPRREIEIKSQVSGVVDKLFVEAGDQVDKGDLIARIQLIPDMEHLSSAESALRTAEISLKNARIEHERQSQLYKDGLIGELAYNGFVLNYELRQEAVISATDTVDLIKEGASRKNGNVANLVRSTITGMVLDVPVREGTFVTETNNFNQGTNIANVANMLDLIFEGDLDESEIGKVEVGMPLILNVGAISDQSFNADLEYVSPKGVDDQGTIKFQIRAAVAVQENVFLRAGYSANADIVLDRRDQVLVVNEGNLITEDGMSYVEVETGEQEFERREIETGLSDGINIEVLSGVTEDTKFKKLAQ